MFDTHQNRGIATASLLRLAGRARAHDITTFTASVMCDGSSLVRMHPGE